MHVYRPLFIVAGVVALFFIVRAFITPADFGIGKRGYTYAFYRTSAVEEAKSVKVKYRGAQYCSNCHAQRYETWSTSLHGVVKCENCHGPAIDHPVKPPKLTIDRSRTLCLRCHALLPYEASGRVNIRGIDPDKHYMGVPCATCHNPHHPVRMEKK
jgi:predicted CXXCH cytochrome family protein